MVVSEVPTAAREQESLCSQGPSKGVWCWNPKAPPPSFDRPPPVATSFAALPHLSALPLQAAYPLLLPLPAHPSGPTDRPHPRYSTGRESTHSLGEGTVEGGLQMRNEKERKGDSRRAEDARKHTGFAVQTHLLPSALFLVFIASGLALAFQGHTNRTGISSRLDVI